LGIFYKTFLHPFSTIFIHLIVPIQAL